MLWGPMNHIKHLLAYERLPFTSAYFGTMFATIYFAIWVSFFPFVWLGQKKVVVMWVT